MSKKILLVEDTFDLRHNIVDLLTMEGFEVCEAANGKKAMDLLKDFIPHLIITDLHMPEMDGFSLIEQVRKTSRRKNIPILVFSAMPANENEKKVLELGANIYLKKPSTLEALVQVVNKLINNE